MKTDLNYNFSPFREDLAAKRRDFHRTKYYIDVPATPSERSCGFLALFLFSSGLTWGGGVLIGSLISKNTFVILALTPAPGIAINYQLICHLWNKNKHFQDSVTNAVMQDMYGPAEYMSIAERRLGEMGIQSNCIEMQELP
jgi:hypothetical protein